MFDISWGDFLVLIVAGLFILGPERLPGAAKWLGQTVRKVREYANGARDQLSTELGPEFENFREPLQDLRKLRNFDPRRAATQYLLDATDGYDPRDDLKDLTNGLSLGGGSTTGNGSNGTAIKPNGFPSPGVQQPKLAPGERPPFDPDAT